MKKYYYKRLLKILIVFIVSVILLVLLSFLTKPKYFLHSDFSSPETEMWNEFYRTPDNSTDIIFAGSSHVYCGICPAEIYSQSGIKSFNLSTSNQNLMECYYVLSEGFKYQSPQYVILDTFGLFSQNDHMENYKSAFDDMKWSANKLNAEITAISTLKDSNNIIKNVKLFLCRLFPILEFHYRWDELDKFSFSNKESCSTIKGYSPLEKITPVRFDDYYIDNGEIISEESQTWLYKIKELCDNNNSTLVLICIPCHDWNYGCFKAVNQIALVNNIPFIDFNIPDIYSQILLDENKDFYNEDHLNITGAQKFSKYLTNSILAQSISNVENTDDDTSWNQLTNKWNLDLEKCNIKQFERYPEYFDYIISQDNTVLITISGKLQNIISEELSDSLNRIGVYLPESSEDIDSLICVISNGKAIDVKYGFENENVICDYDNNNKHFCAMLIKDEKSVEGQKGYGNNSVIAIDEKDYSLNEAGMNVLVFSNQYNDLLDVSCADIMYSLNVYREND